MTGLGVREGAAWVAENAQSVKINHDRIADYTAMLLAKYPLITKMDDSVHFVSGMSPELTVAYMIALDSINFGSGYFGIAKKEGIALEYDIIAGALKDAFKRGDLNTPEKWADATMETFQDMLRVPSGSGLDPLMINFANHLNAMGDFINNFFSGDVEKLMAAANGSAVRLAQIVSADPSFHDAAQYLGRKVPVMKRAQILAADINLSLGGDVFSDMDQLTIFADNMVPHVLRHDGVLEYAPDLAARIDNREMIASGSADETELRCVAIHAVELMRASAGGRVTSVNLDHIIWHRGYEPAIYAKPSHKTLSVWY